MLNNPNSTNPHSRSVPVFPSFLFPFLVLFQQVCVFNVLRTQCEHSTTSGVLQEQSRGAKSFPLELLTMYLVMLPRIQLAFWAVNAHFQLVSSLIFVWKRHCLPMLRTGLFSRCVGISSCPAAPCWGR